MNVRDASGLDKFYTIPSVSQTCLATIGRMYEWANWDLVVEPSAGNGSFLFETNPPIACCKQIIKRSGAK